MFGRSKRKGKGPVANKLSGAAEPNVLKSSKSGKSGKSKSSGLEWTAGVEPEDEFEPEDDLDDFDAGTDSDNEEDEEDTRTAAQRRADLEAELQRQAEEFGLTGDNSGAYYGPNGESVVSLLDSLPSIDDETAEEIADAYEAVPDAERKVARSVIRRRHRGGKLDAELFAAEQAVAEWFSSLMLTDDDAPLYAIVADAATDAVDALVLEDALDDADFDTLYGPWSEVMDADEDEADGPDDSAGTGAAAGAAEKAGAAEEAVEGAEPQGEFGPNTTLVIEFLGKLGGLDAAQTAELVAAWREGPKDELKTAHRALQGLADEDATWREQLRLAQEEIFSWMAGGDSRFYELAHASRDELRIRESAGPAAADAVAALVLADMLEPEDAEVLYAPWAETVGEPALPQYEDDDE